MRSHGAFWPFAFAGSLALHSMLTLAVSGLAHRIQAPPPLAEFIIGEDLPLPAEMLAPSSVEMGTALPTAEAASASQAEAAEPVEAPSANSESLAAASPANQQLAAAAPDESLAPSPASGQSLASRAEDRQLPAAPTAQTAARVEETQVPEAAQPADAEVQQDAAVLEADPAPVAEVAPAPAAEDAASLPAALSGPAAESLVPAPQQLQAPAVPDGGTAPAIQAEEASPLSAPSDNVAEPAVAPPEPSEAPVAAGAPNIFQQTEPADTPQAPSQDKAAALQNVPVIVAKPAESVAARPAQAETVKETQIAALPPATAPPESRAEHMRRFLRNYDGGGCFFAVPIALDSPKPRIDGFGSRREPIFAFGEEFKRALGVAPDIGMRDITDEQCPAIHFIGGLLKSRFPELRVKLDLDQIASGSELRGSLEGVRLRWAYLVLIDDDGMVQDLSQFLSTSDGRLTFAAPMTVQGQGRLRNQLLVGVATSQELELLKTDKPIRGEDFFPAVVDEADAKGADVALGVGAFRVE